MKAAGPVLVGASCTSWKLTAASVEFVRRLVFIIPVFQLKANHIRPLDLVFRAFELALVVAGEDISSFAGHGISGPVDQKDAVSHCHNHVKLGGSAAEACRSGVNIGPFGGFLLVWPFGGGSLL